MKKGEYYIYLEHEVVPVRKPADVALDVFLKMFKVTGSPVPTELRKIHAFVNIVAYKVPESSTHASVNTLAASFMKTTQAEKSDSEWTFHFDYIPLNVSFDDHLDYFTIIF